MINMDTKNSHAEQFRPMVRDESKTRNLAISMRFIIYYTCNRLIVIHKMSSSQNYMNIKPENN